MTGTSIEDMEKVGDDLLVSSFITNSLGMAEAGPLYMARVVRVRRGNVGNSRIQSDLVECDYMRERARTPYLYATVSDL